MNIYTGTYLDMPKHCQNPCTIIIWYRYMVLYMFGRIILILHTVSNSDIG